MQGNSTKRKHDRDLISSEPCISKPTCQLPSSAVFDNSAPLPLRSDSSIDIIKIVEYVIPRLNAKTIHLGSSRSFKSSKHLRVDSSNYAQVPRESIYDAEMYRVLVDWLTYHHKIDVTGQWHLENVGSDGYYHHSYCDLSLNYADVDKPIAILELLATASNPVLLRHFEQIFLYGNQLNTNNLWIIHFSREDNILSSPLWPSTTLLEKGLNVIHIWHNNNFSHVRMSAIYTDTSREIKKISNFPII